MTQQDADESLACEHPQYDDLKTIPSSTLDTLVHALGYQQWLSPNADSEYGAEARRLCQNIYAAKLISAASRDRLNWDDLRQFRAHIFDDHFYCPSNFDTLEYATPDDMFDAVEAELADSIIIDESPPVRDKNYVSLPEECQEDSGK
jgi:hypothetical protein